MPDETTTKAETSAPATSKAATAGTGDAQWKASIFKSVEGIPPNHKVSIQAVTLRNALGADVAAANGVEPMYGANKLVEISVQKIRELCGS